MTQYELIRSRRKTAAIHITKDAVVEVRAPLKMPKASIDRFVASKEQWIRTTLEKVTVRLAAQAAFTLDYGSQITLLGKEYTISAGQSRRVGYGEIGVLIPSDLSPAEVKRAVIRLYRSVARNKLIERTQRIAPMMGVVPAAIRITGAKTRWGSCSSKNSINFSWRLIMADDEIIEYVIVHELAHIKEHNHSPRFWAVVEGILPDYKFRRRRLKLLQSKLAVEDWDE